MVLERRLTCGETVFCVASVVLNRACFAAGRKARPFPNLEAEYMSKIRNELLYRMVVKLIDQKAATKHNETKQNEIVGKLEVQTRRTVSIGCFSLTKLPTLAPPKSSYYGGKGKVRLNPCATLYPYLLATQFSHPWPWPSASAAPQYTLADT